MASAKKWLTQVFHSKRKNEQGTTQGASDSDNNTASTSASLIPNSPVVPSTSIQKLFPANKIYGLRDVYVPDDAVVDIVFLHGLNGRADTTFFHEGSGTFWPVDLLSKDVPNARILTYGYDAGVTNFFKPVGQNTLRDHASNLVNGLAAKRLDASYVPRKLIFVVHSLGGLVIKRAIALSEVSADEHLKHIERDTIGIVFLGTPHRGSDMAPFTTAVGNILKSAGIRTNVDILEVLQRNSQVLAGVEDDFSSWLRKTVGRFQLTCFFEELELPGVGRVVKRESATIAGWPNQSIHTNHMDMAKFPDSDDDGYQRVLAELKRWMKPLRKDVGTPDSSQKDLKAILLTHIDNTGLALKDVLNVSNIPKSANETGLLANIEKSLEWFTQSPEFQTWKEKELCTSLWLHGKPGVGKTVVMSYVLQHLPRLLGYAKNWDIAAIFCSNNQSQDLILVSLIFQLIKHNLRVQFARPIIESWDTSLTGFDLSNYLWRVLEAMVTAVPGRETIFLFDGMDSLERAVMSTFLANFLSLERRSAASGAAIRVLISSRPYPYIREALASYASIEPEKERNECLRTLYFQEWNARETRVDDAPQGGNWLPLHQEYREWIKNPVSDLLWIEGKPGSGKSTLTKQIVQKLHDERNVPSQRELNNADLDQHTIIAAFYYSFRGGVTETSHELMLRSIVYQIWSQNTRLFPLLQDSYRRLKLNGDNHSRMGPFWRYEDLKFALQSLHQVNFPLQIFIVADGMDESDNIRRSDLLSFLRNLSLQTSNCIMKVLFASRPETDINLHLQGDHHIILQKENAEDIRKVVMSWCEGLKYHSVPQDNTKEPPSTKSRYPDDFFKVGDYIAENSQGVFLWVSLVIRDLDALIRKGAYTIASLEKRVRKLPKDLGGRNGFYHAIVQSLIRRQDEDEILDEDDKENERRQARKILTWMTFPKRPISMHELEDVLAIPLQIEDKDLRTYDFERHRPRELDRGLISYCGGLLEVRGIHRGRTVQLIHQTVREFLLDRNRLAEPYHLDEVEGDCLISSTCCSNIRITFAAAPFQTEADHDFSQIDLITTYLNNNNLLQYSLSYFTKHLEHSGNNGLDVRRVFESFIGEVMSGPTHYSSLLLSKWAMFYWPSEKIMSIHQINVERCLQAALCCAAANGKDQALEILVRLEANINALGGEYGTALQAASFQGHETIVQQLLDYGADGDAQGGQYGTALQAASFQGHKSIVKLLLRKGVNVNAQGGQFGSALEAASFQGHGIIVGKLLAAGADVNAQSRHHGTALQAASFQGHEMTVELLLEHGAGFNAVGNKYDIAIQVATNQGHKRIVELLLQYKVDIGLPRPYIANFLPFNFEESLN